MKLLLKTNSTQTYYIHIPNHLDLNCIPEIIDEAKFVLPPGVEIVEHHMHSDQMTNDEKKQLDLYGEITNPLVKLDVNIFH